MCEGRGGEGVCEERGRECVKGEGREWRGERRGRKKVEEMRKIHVCGEGCVGRGVWGTSGTHTKGEIR